MTETEVSINVQTKNIFNYDYCERFLTYTKYVKFTDYLKTEK